MMTDVFFSHPAVLFFIGRSALQNAVSEFNQIVAIATTAPPGHKTDWNSSASPATDAWKAAECWSEPGGYHRMRDHHRRMLRFSLEPSTAPFSSWSSTKATASLDWRQRITAAKNRSGAITRGNWRSASLTFA